MLRYQKVFSLKKSKDNKIYLVNKKIEILANSSKIKELLDILKISDIIEKKEKIILFDLEQINIIYSLKDKIKEISKDISINLYPETILFLYNILFQNKIEQQKDDTIFKLKQLNNEFNLSIEIIENGEIEYSLVNKYNLSFFLSIFKKLGIDISIDDISISNKDNHNLDNLEYIIKYFNDYIHFLKIDIILTKQLKSNNNNNKIYKILDKYKKKIIFEGIETKQGIQKIIKDIKKYPFLFKRIYFQGYYLHKPENIGKPENLEEENLEELDIEELDIEELDIEELDIEEENKKNNK